MPRVIQSQRVWILLRGFTRWKGSSGSLENHIRVMFENLWVWFYILLESFQNQSLKVKRRGELENRLETLGEVLFVLKPLLSAQGFLHPVERALWRSTRSLVWSRRNSDWTILAKELELHWSASNMQPKTAFTFVLSNQKPSELPKAAVQHFLHHCCLTPAPTHPLSRVSTRSTPASPREAASLSLLPQELLHARARGSWFSRATSELSIIRAQFAFSLSASHLSSPKLTLQLCVPLAGSLLCSSAPHLVTQNDFNLFFFFFQLDVPPSWSKPAELCSSRDVFARTEYSSRSFWTYLAFFFPGLKLSWPPGSWQISDCLVLEEDYCDECFDITHEHMLLIANGNKASSTQRGRQWLTAAN